MKKMVIEKELWVIFPYKGADSEAPIHVQSGGLSNDGTMPMDTDAARVDWDGEIHEGGDISGEEKHTEGNFMLISIGNTLATCQGFGRKGTDEEHPQKRKSKQVAATLDSADEPHHSSRFRGVSNRRKGGSKENLNTRDYDLYMETIWRDLPEDRKNLFACLDPLWFSTYITNASKVLRWVKEKNILSKKYVLVPIVLWHHWFLLIFCHLGESLESESPTPCMLLLDSLHDANPLRLEPEIRKFVSGIFENEERPESEKLVSEIKLLVPKVPQQRNNTDCGKFVLYYISLFLESAPEKFSISEGYPYFMKEDWFTPDQLANFWQKLQTETTD